VCACLKSLKSERTAAAAGSQHLRHRAPGPERNGQAPRIQTDAIICQFDESSTLQIASFDNAGSRCAHRRMCPKPGTNTASHLTALPRPPTGPFGRRSRYLRVTFGIFKLIAHVCSGQGQRCGVHDEGRCLVHVFNGVRLAPLRRECQLDLRPDIYKYTLSPDVCVCSIALQRSFFLCMLTRLRRGDDATQGERDMA
jgi:hypothetical protein